MHLHQLSGIRATSNRPDSQAVQNSNIDLQFNLENLNKGNNVLAIQGLNRSEIGADFLISPELTITKAPDQADLATGYFLNPTPGLINNESILGFVKDTQFSLKRGFFDRAFDLEISSSTPESTIKYTTDGSTPDKKYRDNLHKTHKNK